MSDALNAPWDHVLWSTLHKSQKPENPATDTIRKTEWPKEG